MSFNQPTEGKNWTESWARKRICSLPDSPLAETLVFFCLWTWTVTDTNWLSCFNIDTGGASGKEPTCQCRRCKKRRFNSWVRKIPSGGGYGNPLHSSFLENPMDRGAWQNSVHMVAKSQTWLKWLNTHTHIDINGVPWWLRGKEFTCQCWRHRSLGQEDLLEKEMATHSSILA